ncbi:MAG: MgtC/SapB family protein, partial [Gammaproteobacteria bacterium]
MNRHASRDVTEPQEAALELMTTDAGQAAAVLAAALGCGLLIGIERERRKGSGPGRSFAGLRTFSLTSVLGAVAALSGEAALLAIGAAFVSGLALMAYWRDRSDDPGVTTEVALLLTYVIGALTAWHMPVAAALAVGMTGLLAARARLHQLASQWLSAGEVRDGIVLAALVLMALPLVTDRPLWGQVLNPHVILQLLALLLAVQSLAHFCRRLLEARQAVAFSALASGFVSSTATIATLGLAVREQRADARLMAAGGLFSCVSTQLQVLLVASAVRSEWLRVLWLPALG